MNEHKNRFIDAEHTKFLYWVHQLDGSWSSTILVAGVDASKEFLEAINDDFNREYLNDRYQEDLIDYNFIIKRQRFESGISDLHDQVAKSDPYEELADPIGSIIDVLFPEVTEDSEMVKKFTWALTQLQPQQVQLLVDYYIFHKTMQQIADEENAANGTNIKHQAITNRMNKIFLRFEKLMPEYGSTAKRRKSSK